MGRWAVSSLKCNGLEHFVPVCHEVEVWKEIFAALVTEADNEYAMIDSTIVRARQHSAGALKKGATRPSV